MSVAERLAAVVVLAAAAAIAAPGAEQVPKGKLGFDDTPMLPGGKWRVHDGTRPQPAAVGTAGAPGAPPSDAQVLFGGSDLSRWHNSRGEPAGWKIDDGAMVVTPRAGDILTKEEFGDVQLHVEWAAPSAVSGDGQDRGNSGVFLMGRYEIQVLDSYRSPTYPDGQAAAIYGQFPPLVNATRPPGEWQVYDIIFTGPRFEGGALATPAFVTVLHNGVAVHNHTALIGGTAHKVVGKYDPHPMRGPIRLQDHGNPVRYRNIWVREIGGYDGR
ncbi:MAG: family 16 glycoside hydrolase [Vicinamibacterales bacterium]